MAYAGNSVYWVGQDGNIYYKSGTNVRNVGKPINLYQNGFDSNQISAVASLIPDPNPGNGAPSAPAGGSSGGGSSGPVTPDKSIDINAQLRGLDALGSKQSGELADVETSLNNLKGRYATEAKQAESAYGTSSTTNKQNFEKNKATALVHASQGRQGLFGTLSSLGALGGTALELANRAVQQGANEDISGAQDTFGTNKLGLDTAIGTFRSQDEQRNKDAELSATQARRNVASGIASDRQKFYQNLANDYAEQGDTANAKKYGDLAASLYPEIGKNATAGVSFAPQSAVFTAPSLESYLGSGGTTVTTTPGVAGGLPGLIAIPSLKKKQLQPA